MIKKRERAGASNEGIQAGGNVSAEVMAVGRGATAIKNESVSADRETLQLKVVELEQAIARMIKDGDARAALAEDIAALKDAMAQPKPDPEAVARPVQGLTGKLKMVGIAIKEVAALVEPIKAIAMLLQIPLKLFGL